MMGLESRRGMLMRVLMSMAPGRQGKEIDMARRFADLSEAEILALAISNEEEDSRIYADIDFALRADYPATAKVFEGMEAEEQEHRRGVAGVYRRRVGEDISLIGGGGWGGVFWVH